VYLCFSIAMSAARPLPASRPSRQGYAPTESVVRSRSPRPPQAKTGGDEDDTELVGSGHTFRLN